MPNINSMFQTAQQITNKLTMLQRLHEAYLKDPINDTYKDDCIKLSLECGELYFNDGDLEKAKAHLESAKELAGDTHSRSLDITTKLLEIAEKEALSSGASAAAKK